MNIFIRAASCISPQQTFDDNIFSSAAKEYNSNILDVIEPDYKNLIDAKLLRRMSKIIRIGVATATACLREAGHENVDAIITATAYGCMEDSELFLKKIVEQNEEMLSPTSFIQSTHNTVGAQIALMLKCHKYNNTFVHKGFSFEYALLDAIMRFSEQEAQTILAGSADEITDITFSILKRFGLYKTLPVSNFHLYNSNSKGSIAGQGAAFFLLSDQSSETDYAKLDALDFFKHNNSDEIINRIQQFINAETIDLLITGRNGDYKNEMFYDDVQNTIFKDVSAINFKHLCGEYPTASSFAMWLAANIIKQNKLPSWYETEDLNTNNFRRILIYNNHQGTHHSLMLLSSVN